MTIALFSGQGSQYPGMGKDLLERYPSLADIYDAASDVFGRDMKSLCFDSTPEELALTINAQPAVFLTSLVCITAAMLKHDPTGANESKTGFIRGVAGHSLGEYAALSFTYLGLEKALLLIKTRSEAMHRAAQETNGAMAAVMKLDPAKIEEICASADNYVVPVNYNSPQQTVIAGTPEGIAEVTPVFAELKAKVSPLKVAGAFHSKLMQPAADEFRAEAEKILADTDLTKTAAYKYYSNVTGGEKTDFTDLPEYLAQHIISPVRFTDELAAMQEDGFTRFIEYGPGKTLTGLVKRTLKGVDTWNISNLETLESRDINE